MAVAPLLAGLYAGDVDRLSAPATFPELVAWEAAQGSLIRGSQAASRAARRVDPGPMFVKPRGGVSRLTEALAGSLGDRVATDASVASLDDVAGADAVVLATPAVRGRPPGPSATPPTPPTCSTASRTPRRPSSSRCIRRGRRAALPPGTGFVVPRGRAPMTACTWISSKWPDPAFGTRAVVRFYVGAVGDEDVVEAADDELIQACARHLAAVVDLPERPEQGGGRSMAASDAAVRAGAPGPRADGSGRACLRVSSWWAPPTTAWASPTACVRRARRPSWSCRT